MHTPLFLLLLLIIIFAINTASAATWCICRTDMSDTVLQKTLDYACGAGADCAPILANGACFQPNTVRSHCSYAVNSYFQRKGQVPGSCDFAGTAIATVTDPSYSPCLYASLSSSPVLPGATTPVISTIPPPPPPPPPPPQQQQGIILPPPSFTPTTTVPYTFPPPTNTIPYTFPPPTPTTTMGGGGMIGFGPPAGTGTTSDGNGSSSSDGGSRPLKQRRISLLVAMSLIAFV